MSDATYKIITRDDSGGAPLLIVKFQVEYEVILNADRFTELQKTVAQFSDGVTGDKLTPEETLLWEDELRRIGSYRNAIGELAPYQFMELETKPKTIPRGLLHQILTTFEENAKSEIRLFVTGSVPNFSLNINWGTLTYTFPIPQDQIEPSKTAFSQASVAAQKCINEGQDPDKATQSILDTIKAVAGTGKVTIDIYKCASAMSKASRSGVLGILGAFVTSCTDIFADLSTLIENFIKEQEERDAAARQKQQDEVDAGIDRISKCPNIDAGIEKSRDIDRAEIISRTA
ncbi:hypothetical protein [Pseudomonas moorei]|uniref:Uncharacterized protein n=1 Tax=Pseudomonas moorei TaxID=395599 RepID=A0A1H1EIT3_9PSED|nr:hypothetical protein [Pseudomonas moorei]KAB0507752.1 hypothetical protein F7R06_06255 [Pseudomonas moorei]SDQ88691.1 hypothetical protein SAMN04490195_2220 [Pseudomonas moorei]